MAGYNTDHQSGVKLGYKVRKMGGLLDSSVQLSISICSQLEPIITNLRDSSTGQFGSSKKDVNCLTVAGNIKLLQHTTFVAAQ
jgi:hypothetical protein